MTSDRDVELRGALQALRAVAGLTHPAALSRHRRIRHARGFHRLLAADQVDNLLELCSHR